MRSAIVARVCVRNPMEVADDLGHRFWRLLPYADNPPGISVSLQVEHKQFIEMGTSSAHRLGEPHTSSPRYAIGRVTAFSKSATGKTDVSFDI